MTTQEYQKFSDKDHVKEIYPAMNETEKERFALYRSTNFQDKQIKKVMDFHLNIITNRGFQILSLIPGTGKANKKINTAIKALTKIYVGQLVEEGKLIQVQETREEEIYYAYLMQQRD